MLLLIIPEIVTVFYPTKTAVCFFKFKLSSMESSSSDSTADQVGNLCLPWPSLCIVCHALHARYYENLRLSGIDEIPANGAQSKRTTEVGKITKLTPDLSVGAIVAENVNAESKSYCEGGDTEEIPKDASVGWGPLPPLCKLQIISPHWYGSNPTIPSPSLLRPHTTYLHFANLPPSFEEGNLRDLCILYGEIASARMVDNNGLTKEGYVKYKDAKHAYNACASMNGQKLDEDGRGIVVRVLSD